MAVVGLSLTACDDLPGLKDKKPETAAGPEQPALSTAGNKLQAIKTALQARNVGVARDLARQAQLEFPADPEVHLARARIEAELGNAGDAAPAFGLALDNGLSGPTEALAAPIFDEVRDGPAFADVRRRLAGAEPASTGRKGVAPPRVTSRVRAGDVEIVETDKGAGIRAGDLRLDADD